MRHKSHDVASVLLLVFVSLIFLTPAGAATDRLPDLQMARLRDLQIENTLDGRRLLRFTATIANTGDGPLEVVAQRTDTNTAWSITQRVYNDAGQTRSVTMPDASLIYGGDGHSHWHIRNMQRVELQRLDDDGKVGRSLKSGFCFFDNEHFGAATPPVYTQQTMPPVCGRGSDLTLTMGLSPGWGDKYPATLPDQYVDITGLAAGRYRLLARADPDKWFVETDSSNNFTWVDLELTGSELRIIDYGDVATGSGNLMQNPGFELDVDLDDTLDRWSTNSNFVRSSAIVRSGVYSGRYAATDNSNDGVSQTVLNLAENIPYQFRGWVNIPDTSDTFTFELNVFWRDGTNTVISSQTIGQFTSSTNGWEMVQSSFIAPARTANAVIRLAVRDLNATIYVDDFELRATGAAPDTISPIVVARNPESDVNTASADTNIMVTFSENVTGVSGSTLTLQSQGGAVVPASVTYSSATKTATLTPRSPLVPEMNYTVSLTSGIVDAAGNALAPVRWSFAVAQPPKVFLPLIRKP